MADLRLSTADQLFGHSILGAESILDALRSELADTLAAEAARRRPLFSRPILLVAAAARMLYAVRPILVEHLADTAIAAWIAGMDEGLKQFPDWLVEEFRSGIRSGPPDSPPPPAMRLLGMFNDEPRLRLPLIEQAARKLSQLNVVTRPQWDLLAKDARDRAFTITGDLTTDAIADVRDSLAAEVRSGPSLDGFRNRVEEALQRSSIGSARVETIYRTNVQTAYRNGRETLASDPLVQDLFPYQAYLAIHNARVRSTHLALESLGLSGTNIYRRDDPFWDRFTPPNGFNCRCGVRLLTVQDAAAAGVLEAQRWLASGEPPAEPHWRYRSIPFEPELGFGSRGVPGRVAA